MVGWSDKDDKSSTFASKIKHFLADTSSPQAVH